MPLQNFELCYIPIKGPETAICKLASQVILIPTSKQRSL